MTLTQVTDVVDERDYALKMVRVPLKYSGQSPYQEVRGWSFSFGTPSLCNRKI